MHSRPPSTAISASSGRVLPDCTPRAAASAGSRPRDTHHVIGHGTAAARCCSVWRRRYPPGPAPAAGVELLDEHLPFGQLQLRIVAGLHRQHPEVFSAPRPAHVRRNPPGSRPARCAPPPEFQPLDHPRPIRPRQHGAQRNQPAVAQKPAQHPGLFLIGLPLLGHDPADLRKALAPGRAGAPCARRSPFPDRSRQHLHMQALSANSSRFCRLAVRWMLPCSSTSIASVRFIRAAASRQPPVPAMNSGLETASDSTPARGPRVSTVAACTPSAGRPLRGSIRWQ